MNIFTDIRVLEKNTFRQIDRKGNKIGRMLSYIYFYFDMLDNVSKFVHIVARHHVGLYKLIFAYDTNGVVEYIL